MLYAFFDRGKADKVMEVASISHNKFSKFITGECLEACYIRWIMFYWNDYL